MNAEREVRGAVFQRKDMWRLAKRAGAPFLARFFA
jgi:hypothetical protein